MTGGYISGGWSFVWAAYGWTAIVLTVYAISLFTRMRRAPHPGPLPAARGEGEQR